MERPLIFSILLEGDRHFLNKKEWEASGKIKRRSTQDKNDLVALHIKGYLYTCAIVKQK